jgi:hypothetical protein
MRQIPTLLVLLLAFAACSDLPPIDTSISFNIVRNANFVAANGVPAGVDTSIIAHISIDTNKDYATNKTAAYLLTSSRITRLVLTSNDVSLDNLLFARVLIGADTIADSIESRTSNEIRLHTTGNDITKYMQDTAFDAVLQFRLQNNANPGTINASMTVVHTALHLPLVE